MIGIIWFSSLSTLPSDPGRRAGRILRVKEDHDVLTMKCNGKGRILRSGLRMTGRDGTNRAGRVILISPSAFLSGKRSIREPGFPSDRSERSTVLKVSAQKFKALKRALTRGLGEASQLNPYLDSVQKMGVLGCGDRCKMLHGENEPLRT